jgi:endoglucanase
VLQGESDNSRLEEFPTDPIPNRLMYESHNYTPSLFTFFAEDQTWGDMYYYWGAGHHSDIEPSRNATWGEEDENEKYFQELKIKYIDQGIPVLMGEYAADHRTTPQDIDAHNESVDYWITFVTQKAISNGIIPFYWETGKIIDRNTVIDQRTIDAIFAGGE